MTSRFTITMSDDLNREIDRVAAETASNKGEILRKALQLFLAARQGAQDGLRVGLVDPASGQIKTEIVGL